MSNGSTQILSLKCVPTQKSTVEYFEQFCAISKVPIVLNEDYTNYHVIDFIEKCLHIFAQIYFEYVSFRLRLT